MSTNHVAEHNHPFYAGMKKESIKLISGMSEKMSFKPGERILKEGQEAGHFYLIIEGKVSIGLRVPGEGEIIFETIGEGEIIGWSWLIAPHIWRFNATAVDPTEVIAVDAHNLVELCEKDHELGYQLLKKMVHVIGDRLTATRLQLLDIYAK